MKESLHQIGEDVPLENLLIFDVNDRGPHVAGNHLLRVLEEMRIVRRAVGVGHDRRDRTPSAARASGALLVVRDMGRHVSERDAGQRADVDADLHRRRAAQHIDWRFAVERDVLEPELVFFDFVEGTFVGLTSELSGVFHGTQAERLEVDRVECSPHLLPVEPCAGIEIVRVRLDKAAEARGTHVGEGFGEDAPAVPATEPAAFEPKVQSQALAVCR